MGRPRADLAHSRCGATSGHRHGHTCEVMFNVQRTSELAVTELSKEVGKTLWTLLRAAEVAMLLQLEAIPSTAEQARSTPASSGRVRAQTCCLRATLGRVSAAVAGHGTT